MFELRDRMGGEVNEKKVNFVVMGGEGRIMYFGSRCE